MTRKARASGALRRPHTASSAVSSFGVHSTSTLAPPLGSTSRAPSPMLGHPDEGASHVGAMSSSVLDLTLEKHGRPLREPFVKKRGRRYHAYAPREVPYARSYDSDVLDQLSPILFLGLLMLWG